MTSEVTQKNWVLDGGVRVGTLQVDSQQWRQPVNSHTQTDMYETRKAAGAWAVIGGLVSVFGVGQALSGYSAEPAIRATDPERADALIEACNLQMTVSAIVFGTAIFAAVYALYSQNKH